MDSTTVLEWGVQIGIPAVLGVALVMYLVKVLIPKQFEILDKQTQTFHEALQSQQQLFRDALKSEQQSHSQVMDTVVDTMRDEHGQTRQALNELSRQTSTLSEAVFKLYGKQGGNGDKRS